MAFDAERANGEEREQALLTLKKELDDLHFTSGGDTARQQLDVDGDGYICAPELKSVLEANGVLMPEDILCEILAETQDFTKERKEAKTKSHSRRLSLENVFDMDHLSGLLEHKKVVHVSIMISTPHIYICIISLNWQEVSLDDFLVFMGSLTPSSARVLWKEAVWNLLCSVAFWFLVCWLVSSVMIMAWAFLPPKPYVEFNIVAYVLYAMGCTGYIMIEVHVINSRFHEIELGKVPTIGSHFSHHAQIIFFSVRSLRVPCVSGVRRIKLRSKNKPVFSQMIN
jgi:hypothetical protein